MRSAQVSITSLAAFAAVALAAAACGGGSSAPNITRQADTDYHEVCVDERGNRVNDDDCPGPGFSGSGGHHYVYVPHSHPVPAVGHPVTGHTNVRPAGVRVGKAPTGGFGGRGGTSGS